MSNAVTFIIDLQDKLSAKIQNLSNSSNNLQRKFAEVTRVSSDMNTKINTLGTTSSMLRQRIEALRIKSEMIPVREINKIRECNREIKRLSGQLNTLETINGGWFKTKISDTFNSFPGAGFIANPVVALGAGIGKSISLGMENELQKQNITTLMGGDAAAADGLFDKISDYGKTTVYDKAGLIDSQKTSL